MIDHKYEPCQPFLEILPPALAVLPNWALWATLGGRKIPITTNRTRKAARNNVLQDWGNIDRALPLINSQTGLAFLIYENHPYLGIDLDWKHSPDGISQEQLDIINSFVGKAYIEFSPSGKGVHIIALVDKSKLPNKGFNISQAVGVEVYPNKRFFTVTGEIISENEGFTGKFIDCTLIVKSLYAKYANGGNKSNLSDIKTATTFGYQIVEGAGRNNYLFKEAGRLRNLGLSAEAIHQELCVLNNTNCSPPLDESEFCTMAERIMGYDGPVPTVQKKQGKNKPNTEGFEFYDLREIKVKPINWVWNNYLPLGFMVCLCGIAGHGKSNFLYPIIGSITSGIPFPDGSIPEKIGDVILIAQEDSLEHTHIERLRFANADISRVHVIKDCDFSLTTDLHRMEATLKSKQVQLIIIDPINSHLGMSDGKSTWDDSTVRDVLNPWVDLCLKYNVCLLYVTHLSKNEGRSILSRVMGSTAFVALPRIVFVIAKASKIIGPRYHVLVEAKRNLGPKAPPIVFTLESVEGSVNPRVAFYPDMDISMFENIEVETLFDRDIQGSRALRKKEQEVKVDTKAVTMHETIMSEIGLTREDLADRLGCATSDILFRQQLTKLLSDGSIVDLDGKLYAVVNNGESPFEDITSINALIGE